MIGEIEGIKIYVNDGTYTKYKKTLEDEIDELQQENQQLKERIERIDNYLDKNYTAENQYWFDYIRDIIEDR